MRRRKKTHKALSLRGIIIIFVMSTLCFSVGYSLLAQQLSVSGTANLIISEEDNNEFKSDDLLLTFDVKDWYNSGLTYYQYDFSLKNIGNSELKSWKIVIDVPSDAKIVGGWSADYTLVDNKLTITSFSYNSSLKPGDTVTFGLQISTEDSKFVIKTVNLNGTKIEGGGTTDPTDPVDPVDPPIPPVDSKLNVIYTSANSWGSEGAYYTQYDFTVVNNGEANLTEWNFKFEVPEGTTVNNNWNCNYVNADNVITVSNVSHNGNLNVGGSASFGIVLITKSSGFKPVIE